MINRYEQHLRTIQKKTIETAAGSTAADTGRNLCPETGKDDTTTHRGVQGL